MRKLKAGGATRSQNCSSVVYTINVNFSFRLVCSVHYTLSAGLKSGLCDQNLEKLSNQNDLENMESLRKLKLTDFQYQTTTTRLPSLTLSSNLK